MSVPHPAPLPLQIPFHSPLPLPFSPTSSSSPAPTGSVKMQSSRNSTLLSTGIAALDNNHVFTPYTRVPLPHTPQLRRKRSPNAVATATHSCSAGLGGHGVGRAPLNTTPPYAATWAQSPAPPPAPTHLLQLLQPLRHGVRVVSLQVHLARLVHGLDHPAGGRGGLGGTGVKAEELGQNGSGREQKCGGAGELGRGV